MESQSMTQEQESLREVAATDKKSGLGNVVCKMGKGWTCVITKTQGQGPDADAGKVFVKCGENCTCTLNGEAVSQEVNLPANVVSSSENGSEAFCNCGEGWSCAIFKTEGSDAGSGKGFAECSEQYNCSCKC